MSQIQDYRNELVKDKSKVDSEVTKRPTSVDIIKPEVNSKISSLAEAEGKSTRKYVNDLLEMHIDAIEFFSRYLPQIKKIGFDDNLGEIYLRDSKISKSPTISKPDGIIKCDTCKEDIQTSCVHVMYAMGQPEIGRLQMSRKKK
jgi:predicted DNA-binding protein